MDRVGSAGRCNEKVADPHADARIEMIPDGGNWIHVEKPAAMLQAVVRWGLHARPEGGARFSDFAQDGDPHA